MTCGDLFLIIIFVMKQHTAADCFNFAERVFYGNASSRKLYNFAIGSTFFQ
jgi:hypothetical protein